MDLNAICEVLRATQLPDGEVRKKAEQRLDEAAASSPVPLVKALLLPLQAGNVAVPEVRQEAAVILRQLVVPSTLREAIWDRLDAATQKELQANLLRVVEVDPCNPVRRSAGQVLAAIGETVGDDFEELVGAWPELFPTLSRLVSKQCETATRVVALEILINLVPSFGEGLLTQGPDCVGMLRGLLAAEPAEAAEIRAAAAKLMLQMVESLVEEHFRPLGQVVPALIGSLQSLANEGQEQSLKEVLEALSQAIDEEAGFFKANGFTELWKTIMQLASVGPQQFADDVVRHSAMTVAMSLAHELRDEFVTLDGQVQLEHLLALNIAWMLEVEEDVAVWTQDGKEDDEDECDGEAMRIGEENLDQLADDIAEEIIMPILFKVIRGVLATPDVTWKHLRSCLMAVSQVVEHMEEDPFVDQIVDFILQHVDNNHPRVKYAAYRSIAQCCYDQSPHVQEDFYPRIMPPLVAGLQDQNIRVATAAAYGLVAMLEDMDEDDVEIYVEELLTRFFERLRDGGSRSLQSHCLSGIARIAQVAVGAFTPYYSKVIEVLKGIISAAVGKDHRELRSKCFECVGTIGEAVGKEVFAADGKALLEEMIKIAQAGFDADDPFRECFHEVVEMIFRTLGRECKQYVPLLLPLLYEVLKQQPMELNDDFDEDDDDDDDTQVLEVKGKILGLKTTVVEEMEDALDLVSTIVEQLGEEFCEALGPTCRATLPLLQFEIATSVQEKAFEVWGALAASSRLAVQGGMLDIGTLRELVAEFLKKTIGALCTAPGDVEGLACETLLAQSDGAADVIRKAGDGVLPKDAVRDIAVAVMPLFSKMDGTGRRVLKKTEVYDEDFLLDDDEDLPLKDASADKDFAETTMQSVRVSLASILGAMMRTNQQDFLEVAFVPYMQAACNFIKSPKKEDKVLGLCLASDAVDCLGEHTVRFWDECMNDALLLVPDASAAVRRYAASLLGHGARQPAFTASKAAPATLAQLRKVLRRRVSKKAESGLAGVASDACVRAVGQLCEHQEMQLGSDAPHAWNFWLGRLPLRNDEDLAKAAHTQLLSLAARGHPVVTANENVAQVLLILIEIHKSKKLSTAALDAEISSQLAKVGEEQLKQIVSTLPEPKAKKLESAVKATLTATYHTVG
mmetsp:Transcript_11783/g.26684  ORF Transcript_11783/g.26684 Transcript_11783/m.26684 type:complete len:1134 (+) Transcript_11783:61-3462(+)